MKLSSIFALVVSVGVASAADPPPHPGCNETGGPINVVVYDQPNATGNNLGYFLANSGCINFGFTARSFVLAVSQTVNCYYHTAYDCGTSGDKLVRNYPGPNFYREDSPPAIYKSIVCHAQ